MSLISLLENWGKTATPTTSSCTRLLKTLLKSRLKLRTARRRTFNRKRLFATPRLTGTRLFLLFLGVDADQLKQGRLNLSCYSTYCTPPTSMTSEMRTVVRGAVSPTADDATVSAPNQRCPVFLNAFLRDTIFSRHDFRSALTGPASTPIAPQGSNFKLFRTASAAVTAVFSMLIPVSEKVSLREERMKHKILHTCHCPFTFS